MKTKEITLCGQQVTIGYCYATEIGYKILSDQDITDFIAEAIPALQDERMPNPQNTIYLIVAAIQAYYESLPVGPDGKKPEPPVKDSDIIYHGDPLEIGTAIGTILSLRNDFYHVPKDEPKDNETKKGKKKKNA
jgi:hypothetical protein